MRIKKLLITTAAAVLCCAALFILLPAVTLIRWEYDEYAARERDIRSMAAQDTDIFSQPNALMLSKGESKVHISPRWSEGCTDAADDSTAILREYVYDIEECFDKCIWRVTCTGGCVYYECEYEEYIFVYSPGGVPDVGAVSSKTYRRCDMDGDMYFFAHTDS